jgi:phosphatidylinositol-4-phosphate 3-kinase
MITFRAFTEMVATVRSKFKFNDGQTNRGYVTSAFIKSSYPLNTSVKLTVHTDFRSSPLIFTSDGEK